ncbi:hypothetical protein AB1E18_003629 [Capra hircus]
MTLLLLAALVGTLVSAQNASSALPEEPFITPATQKISTAPPSSGFNPLQLGLDKGLSVAQGVRRKIQEKLEEGKKFFEEGTELAQSLRKKFIPVTLFPRFLRS